MLLNSLSECRLPAQGSKSALPFVSPWPERSWSAAPAFQERRNCGLVKLLDREEGEEAADDSHAAHEDESGGVTAPGGVLQEAHNVRA
jgi:hypothetical protein